MPFTNLGNRTVTLAASAGFVALVFACLACSLDTSAPEADGPEPNDFMVLFIGSSYFDANDLPGIFEQIATEAGKQVYVRREVLSGYYLDYFAQSANTEAVIQEREWDYVVLQGGCQNAAYPETHHLITPNSGYHPVYPALSTLQAKVEANHTNTQMVYMMPWAFEDGMTWIEGQTDTYDDMQQEIYDNTLAWADTLGLTVAPVGWAWRAVLREDPPQHYLHLPDWNHPNLRGTYLSALVIFTTLFVESVEDVAYHGGLDEPEARHLQEVATTVVLDNPELWKILPE